MHDKNNNKHYKDCLIEPFYVMINTMTTEEFRGFIKGNVIKYAMRAPFKGDAKKDIDKYKYYSSLLRMVTSFEKETKEHPDTIANLEYYLDEFKRMRGENQEE